MDHQLKQFELHEVEKIYYQWAVLYSENSSPTKFNRRVTELEGKLSELFDRKSPLRSIIVDNLDCTFRYSSEKDSVLVDFWKGPAPDDGRVHSPVKTLKLTEFIFNYCNPQGVYVLEALIFRKT